MELTEIKGIGEKTKTSYEKLGVHNAEELLMYFPRDYELFFEPVYINEIALSTFAAVKGAFAEELFNRKAGKLTITTGMFKDEIGGTLRVTWFNSPFLKNTVEPGKLYVLRGRVTHKYGTFELNQPKVYSDEDYKALIGQMQPVYSLSKGLSNAAVKKSVRFALSTPALSSLSALEFIPLSVRKEFGLCDRKYAIINLHFPESKEAYLAAAGRMSFEEIFAFTLAIKKSEDKLKRPSGAIIKRSPLTIDFISRLPYKLTGAQERVLSEINRDMSSGKEMNRLIQGDVGSGKTLLAIVSLLDAAYSGYQGALMAPTEVLAEQHFETFNKLFKETGVKLNVALLKGAMGSLEKRVVYDALENGRIDILIGTHAIIQEGVNFKNLGLVVTDEQHRFGIKQREALANKGVAPHILAMSATPIPRTMALIIYGGMDVSEVDEMPKGRLPVKNAVVDRSYRKNAYKFIAKEVSKGNQAYVICPLVEYTEGLDAENVTDYADMLKHVYGGSISVGLLHGQMNASQKNEIMSKFASGKIQVLVSTTVIEVGVDVKRATVIMIEDANRFGLSTLHQLRGRVGRSDSQSYCILVSDRNTKAAKERLMILSSTVNGFEIAEKDLEMRGPGEFMGVKQSGIINFKFFDLQRDAAIFRQAISAADRIINGDIFLSDDEEHKMADYIGEIRNSIVL